MKTSLYLTALVLITSLFSSCIKEPPCPRNQQKVEFVLDSENVSLADFISMKPGDEVVIFEAEHFSTKLTDTVKFDKKNAIQQKYRFDGEAFVPADDSSGLDLGKGAYYYCTKDTVERIRVLIHNYANE